MKTLPWSTTIVSIAIGGTPASGVPCSSASWVMSTTTLAGRPWYRHAARLCQPGRICLGRTQSYSRPATSRAFVVNGVSLIATTLRVNRSIATVSSSRTHLPVRRSMAKTSRTVVSSSRYSPGRVATSEP